MGSFIIGRTPYGNQPQTITAKSVSKQHARLTRIDDTHWQLEDIGSSFGTFVEGLPIVSTIVEMDTPIMLADFSTSVRELLGGHKSYSSSLRNEAVNTQIVSVAHLQSVYEDYQEAIKNLVKKKSKAQIMRMLPMQLLMPLALGATGILLPDSQSGNLGKGAIMIGIMALTSILSLRMISISNNQADEQFDLNQQFQIDYVCPKCKNFFGQSKPYKALLHQGQCPYCKSKFKEALND